MMSAKGFIFTAVQETGPQSAPTGFWSCIFPAIHWVHCSWFWIRRIDKYRDLDLAQVSTLLGGVAIQTLWGENWCVKLAAKVADISLRILEITEVYENTCESFSELERLWTTKKAGKIDPELFAAIPCLSWSSLAKVHSKKETLFFRCRRSLEIIKEIVINLFMMSMIVMDTIQAFQGHFLQVVEMPGNIVELSNRLYEGELVGKEALVNRVMSTLVPGYTVQTLKAFSSPSEAKKRRVARENSSKRGSSPPSPSKISPVKIIGSMPGYLSSCIVQALNINQKSSGWTNTIMERRKNLPQGLCAEYNI